MGVKRNILLLTFYYQPDLCAGSFRSTALVEAFKKTLREDDQIDIVSTMPNRYNTFKVNAHEFEEYDGIRIHRIRLPQHKSGLIDQAVSFKKYFFRALAITRKKKYDIVIATSSRLFTAFLGAFVAKRLGNPLYLDIRDIFTDTMSEVLTSKLSRAAIMPLLRSVEKFTFNQADHINLVSEGFRPYFTSRYKKRYSFYTNGIDTEFLECDFSSGHDNDIPVITYAGNIGEGQGLHIIIPKAAKALEGDYKFTIIGGGGARSKLVKSLEALEVTNVQLVDPVNRTELMHYYRNSDYLFFHLNKFKAFEKVLPSKIFEYAVTNKPLIGGVGGYAADFLRENVSDSIIFEPGDVDSFITKLRSFKKGTVNRNPFIKRYSRVNIMRALVDDLTLKYLN